MSTQVKKCIITGLPVKNIITSSDVIYYNLEINEKIISMKFPIEALSWVSDKKDSVFNLKHQNLFKNIIKNGGWIFEGEEEITISQLENLLYCNGFNSRKIVITQKNKN